MKMAAHLAGTRGDYWAAMKAACSVESMAVKSAGEKAVYLAVKRVDRLVSVMVASKVAWKVDCWVAQWVVYSADSLVDCLDKRWVARLAAVMVSRSVVALVAK